MNQKICIAGKNSIAIAGLRYVLEKYSDLEILYLPNSADDGVNGWQPSFKKFGASTRAKQVRLLDLYSEPKLTFLSLEFAEIIRPNLFNSAELFNIHFSLLPKYKGMYTSAIPLLNGEVKSGVTLHKIDRGIDTGPVIDQWEFDIEITDTAKDLYAKYLEYGEKLFKKNIDAVISGAYVSTPQQAFGSTYYSRKSIDYSNVSIDFNKSAYQVHNQFRAYTFREYQLPTFHGWEIGGSRILEQESGRKPGEIIEETDDYFIISTIDYNVMLRKDFYESLWESSRLGITTQLESILDKDIDVEVRNKQGWNALILASFNGRFSSVKKLLEFGANPSATNYKGTTALMYAFSNYERTGDRTIFEALLDAGANTQAKDDLGKSIKDYMIERGNLDLLPLLA